jgi:DNA-binding LytR/AlgR family response regulator
LPLPCIGANDDNVVVFVDKVLYIELVYVKRTPKIMVHTASDEYYSKITGSIESMETLLSPFGFVRVDSGTLVNVNHFSHFEKKFYDVHFCFQNSDKKVICSRSGYSKVKKYLNKIDP